MIEQNQTKTSTLIKKNNQLREQLSTKNKKFYEDLVVLVRTQSFLRNEDVYENFLIDILIDLIDAQNKRVDAETYLGKDIDQTAKEIIAELPKESPVRLLTLSFMFLAIFCVFYFIPNFVGAIFSESHLVQFSLTNFIFSIFFSFLILLFIFKKGVRLFLTEQRKPVLWLKLFAYSVLIYCVFLFISFITKHSWVVSFKLF